MNYSHWTLTSTRDHIEDDVWREGQENNHMTSNGNSSMAEMNLEDFLVKAGVFGYEVSVSDPVAENAQWVQCQHLPSDIVQTPSHRREIPARKRVATGGDIGERIVQRRQKRMLKNRESAARSRARKQAYTHELENKVSRLEEENRRLKEPKVFFDENGDSSTGTRMRFSARMKRVSSHPVADKRILVFLLGQTRDSLVKE